MDEFTKLIEAAAADGWQCNRTKSGRVRLCHPMAARPVIASPSSLDSRALANVAATLARVLRAGLLNALDHAAGLALRGDTAAIRAGGLAECHRLSAIVGLPRSGNSERRAERAFSDFCNPSAAS
jgi:hypothetical protein